MLHSISLSSRTASSTPATSSSYPNNNKKNTLLKSTRTSTRTITGTTAFNTIPASSLSSFPILPPSSSSSSTPTSYPPPSTGSTSLIKGTVQPTNSSSNCPRTSPVPRSQHQHQHRRLALSPTPSLSPARHHPFTNNNSTHKVPPNFTRRLSTSGPSTIFSSPSSLLLPSSLSSCSSTPSPLHNRPPRRLYAAQQQQRHSLGSTATRSSKLDVRTSALADIKGAADTAHFLDERGQPQLLKLSSHHPLLPPPSSSLPSWLSAGGGTAAGDQLQQIRHQRHQQGRTHHGDDGRLDGAESSKTGYGWVERSRQCSADLQNTISDPTTGIITAGATMTATMTMDMSRSSNMIETEGKIGDSLCGDEGTVKVNVGVHGTDGCYDDSDGSDSASRWNSTNTPSADLLQEQQQLPTSPLTPIPTDTLHTSPPSSSPLPSLLSSLQQQASFTGSSTCMTPLPPHSSLFVVASTCCSLDQQLPGTTVTISPTTTTTTVPLTGEVIGPTSLMHDTYLEEQQQQQQVVIHPPTPRSKPKPSPIATKSLRRSNSLGLSTTAINNNNATSTVAQQQAENFSSESGNNTDCKTQSAICGVDGDFLKMFAAGYRGNGSSDGESSCSSNEEDARDSGVVLEPWDHSLLQHQHKQQQQQQQQPHGTRFSEEDIPPKLKTAAKQQQQPRQPFPSFDQLFQPNLDLLDPEMLRRRPNDQKSQRRQRCQSMICPQTPREADMDEQGSLSSDDTDSVTNHHITSAPNSDNDNGDSARIAPGTSGSSTTTKSSDLKAMRRSKRVASMSISSDQHQHLFMGAHGLPPLPPLATSTSGTFNSTNTTKPQRSSFFCSPSLHDSASNSSSDSYSSRDSTAHRPSQPLSNNSTSSVSSTFTSSTSTATIPLTRPSSPPDQHHGQYQSLMGPFAHGMPFSNMLDLATAKAENITGLYFAKQMNNQSKENSRMEAGGSSLQGSEGQHQQQQQYGKDGQAWKRTRAVTSTGSPAMDYFSSAPASADLEKNSTLPILALDGARISGSSLSTTTPSTPAAAGAAFQGTPKMTPPKGLHRRSHSASHFFHLSSLKHHSPAQFNLALCYEHGQGGVEQDLTKALYFYQQAADQGHTKASYNLGCICYNQGEISKAMAWFESAGKCCVQGLKADAGILSSSSSSSSSSTPGSVRRANGPMLECPMPKATILPHELEDMLMMGDHHSGSEGGAGGGGPFVAYLPAILCLALLCRQGVQTRKGEVILRRDPDQAVALLQRLLDRAPARMLNKLEKGHQQSHPPLRQQPSPSLMSAPGSGSRTDTGAAVRRDPQKRASLQTVPTPQQQQQRATTAASSSIFSTSCPQLPLGLSSSMSPLSSSCSASATLAGSGGGGVRVKRPSTVEDADDDDDDDYESAFPTNGSRNNNTTLDPRRSSGQRQRSFLDSEEEDHEEEEEEDLHGSDVHEAWSVILAQQLLKAWQQLLQPQSQPLSHQGRATPASASMEEGRIHQRIVRHHLLYITNPTLGKNFYNLGVLYDLYLEHAQIARRCYRSAYQNCRPCLLSPVHNDAFLPCVLGPSGAGAGVGVESGQATQQRLAGLVTRINSAWNLGVLHAKHQEWPRARSWFLKAQQDVLAHERIVAAASIANAAVESGAQDQDQDLQRRGGRSGGEGEKGVVSDLTALLMKQGTTDGKEAKWSSNAEELLSLGGGRDFEMKQRRSASKKSNGGSDVQQEEGDESKIRRRSLVNVLPSLGGQSNISARGARVERRGRSDGRDGSVGNEREDFLAPKDSFGSRHAREHGLMMHLSTSSSAGSSSSSSKAMRGGASSVKPGNKSTSSLSSSRGGGGNGGGLDGIRTDASKVAWVLRWVESNMDPPCSSSSLSL